MTPDYPTCAFLFCPGCGGQNGTSPSLKHFVCPDCTFTFYSNAAAAVAAFIVNERGEFLWVERAREPQKGKWNVPGGFIDPMESAEDALIRETHEEVGLELSEFHLLASFPNLYTYRNITYHTIDFFFLCVAKSGEIYADASEIARTKWLLPERMSPDQIAFESTKKALERYLFHKQEIGFPESK